MADKDTMMKTALAMFNDPDNKMTLYSVSQACGVSYATLKRRQMGERSMKDYNESRQLLTPKQEVILEAHMSSERPLCLQPCRSNDGVYIHPNI